jgi:hypothetical protein
LNLIRRPLASSIVGGAVAILGLILGPAVVTAQTAVRPAAGAKGQTTGKTTPAVKTAGSKTPWGDPDLQGVFTFSTLTPFQRPSQLAGKPALTETELAAQEEQDASDRVAEDYTPPTGPVVNENIVGAYNNYWTSNEKGRRTGKVALIIDPEDGRIPDLTPRAQQERDRLTAEAAARRVGPYVLYHTWSELPIYTQCVSRPMPRIWQSYNHGAEILQAPGYVVIFYESMHNARIIPLDGRPHLPDNVRLWDGDSRGHWEGDTLVVEWTNFDPRQQWPEYEGSVGQGNVHVVERFTRVDANTINEVVTVADSTTWVKPWTYVLPWRADDPNYQRPEDLYEFACHEGNYRQMENALSGSRAIVAASKGGPPAAKPESK